MIVLPGIWSQKTASRETRDAVSGGRER